MKDKITESKPLIFLHKCEKNETNYEVEIILLPEIGLVTNYMVENYRIQEFVCNQLIQNLPEPALGFCYILAYEPIQTNELSCINLYNYQIHIRELEYPYDQEYVEVEVMDFTLFLDYQKQN